MKLYLISKPIVQWKEFDRFQLDEGVSWQYYGNGFETASSNIDAQDLVELAGRLCYMSFGKGRKTPREYLSNLISKGHFSVFEHPNWTFFITGISRSLTHELIRHRHLSYSQLSQRYVDHSEYPIHAPKEIVSDPVLEPLWNEVMDKIRYFYMMSTGKGKDARTISRAILPNAIETKIAVTGNARAWRDFIKTRDIPEADPEIRELAVMIRKRLIHEAPLLFSDLKVAENVPV